MSRHVPTTAAIIDVENRMGRGLREVVARFFRALADPTRIALVAFLLEGERTQSDCVDHVGLSQSRVSSHLACLVDCGYVAARREGRYVYYSVIDPRIADIVADARAMVAEHAAELASCTRLDDWSATRAAGHRS